MAARIENIVRTNFMAPYFDPALDLSSQAFILLASRP
jgi:hypothetical protein